VIHALAAPLAQPVERAEPALLVTSDAA